MEEKIFIHLESPYLRKFVKWFINGRIKDCDGHAASYVHFDHGYAEVTNGFTAYMWDFTALAATIDEKKLRNGLAELEKLEGNFTPQIHGQYLVLNKDVDIKYPDVKSVFLRKNHRITVHEDDWKNLNFISAAGIFNKNFLKQIFDLPILGDGPIPLRFEIDFYLRISKKDADIGEITIVLSPMSSDTWLAATTQLIPENYDNSGVDRKKMIDASNVDDFKKKYQVNLETLPKKVFEEEHHHAGTD